MSRFFLHEDHALSGCLAGSEGMQFLDMFEENHLVIRQLGSRSSKGGVIGFLNESSI